MNNAPESSASVTRRDFLRTTGLAASAAALSRPLIAREASKPVTLAFVGCAHIHTPGFIKLLTKERDDVVVKYVWDHDAARARHRASELGARVVSRLEEIWQDAAVAGVVICSETNRHRDLVFAAAAAGKHMFVEKPLGITARESAEMAGAIEKAGLRFTTGYFMRTDPKHLFLKEQIERGRFGKLTRVRGSNCHSGSLGGWFDEKPDKPWESWRWMADPKIAGVGAFGDLGTHSLDVLMWLLGDIASVTGDIRVVNGRYGDCDESGEALLRFRNGAIGTLAAGWVDVAEPVPLLISGTEAHAVIANGELYFKCAQVSGADGKSPWKELPPKPPLPLHQFVNALAGEPGMPLVTPREAAARVSVMEAIYSSAKTGSRVALG